MERVSGVNAPVAQSETRPCGGSDTQSKYLMSIVSEYLYQLLDGHTIIKQMRDLLKKVH